MEKELRINIFNQFRELHQLNTVTVKHKFKYSHRNQKTERHAQNSVFSVCVLFLMKNHSAHSYPNMFSIIQQSALVFLCKQLYQVQIHRVIELQSLWLAEKTHVHITRHFKLSYLRCCLAHYRQLGKLLFAIIHQLQFCSIFCCLNKMVSSFNTLLYRRHIMGGSFSLKLNILQNKNYAEAL